MSDIFDHEYDSLIDGLDEMDGFTLFGNSKRNYRNSNASQFSSQYTTTKVIDKLFYHKQIKFKSIKQETEKSYLIEKKKYDVWIPKSICRHIDKENNTVYVHEITWEKIKEKAKLNIASPTH